LPQKDGSFAVSVMADKENPCSALEAGNMCITVGPGPEDDGSKKVAALCAAIPDLLSKSGLGVAAVSSSPQRSSTQTGAALDALADAMAATGGKVRKPRERSERVRSGCAASTNSFFVLASAPEELLAATSTASLCAP
jgi:hypothetical protein